MMAVRYHNCTCHQRHNNHANNRANGSSGGSGQPQDNFPSTYSAVSPDDKELSYSRFIPCNSGNGGGSLHSSSLNDGEIQKRREEEQNSNNDDDGDDKDTGFGLKGAQPWWFHVIASLILVVHGTTFLIPHDPDGDDKDALRTVGGWFGYEMDWVKPYVPYAQGLAAVFNISLGIVSWWTSKTSDRYNRLMQLRVFAFCVNILHAYITGPVVSQGEDVPYMAPGKAVGRIIGLFRLSYLTPGLMAAGVTEVIHDKESAGDGKGKDDDDEDDDDDNDDDDDALGAAAMAAPPVSAQNNSRSAKLSKAEERRRKRRR